MAVIVLVHGIAQEQRSADDLEAEWLPALAGGLRAAGYGQLADRVWRIQGGPGAIEVRMAFYGDRFLGPGVQGLDPDLLTQKERLIADQLARAWLQQAAEDTTDPRERRTAQVELARLDNSLGQAQGPRAAARSAAAGLARLRWFAQPAMAFAERFVWRALAQVTRYFTDEETRAYALKQVTQLIDPSTRVLVGHSLGSVVAYEAAHQLAQPLPLLITLGSPLGLRTIVYERLRPQPPGFPQRVHQWVNVADRDDLVAAAADLTRLFSAHQPATARFEGGWTVDTGAQPHTATFYLNKAQVGRPIAGALRGL